MGAGEKKAVKVQVQKDYGNGKEKLLAKEKPVKPFWCQSHDLSLNCFHSSAEDIISSSSGTSRRSSHG